MNLLHRFWRRSRGGNSEFSTRAYWEGRYASQGDSGAGSYGRLAEFKAEVLNCFVRDNGIERVLEIGCGDGNQLSLADYSSYVGIDAAPSALEMCAKRFHGKRNYLFLLDTDENYRWARAEYRPDLVLSLDVIFHLVEDDLFERYMTNLFSFDSRFVVVYSSNGNFHVNAPHIRNWKFSDWVARKAPGWELAERVPNRFPWQDTDPEGTSFCDFYIYRARTEPCRDC